MRTLYMVFLVVVISACGKNNASSPLGGALDGTWKGSCSAGSAGSSIQTYVFSGNSLTVRVDAYDGTSCAAPSTGAILIRHVQTFSIGDVVGTDGAYKIDVTQQNTYFTLKVDGNSSSIGDAPSANAISLCGISNWAAGTEIDVSGKNCSFFGTYTVGAVLYDLIKKGTSGDRDFIYFGQGAAASVEANRPTTIDSAVAFAKQ